MGIYKLTSINIPVIWGGTNLIEKWGKTTSHSNIGESWLLSTREGNASLLDSGESLTQYLARNPDSVGDRAKKFKDFPILVKFIDAAQSLSVQVHPNDYYAAKMEGQFGKTEMWYIVSAKQNSGIYCGFKSGVTKQEVESAVLEGSLENLLNFYEVKQGDCILIPAGTVHAIGSGIVLFEIQQNSGITYRLYDYNRKDKEGKTRELHLKNSLEVMDINSLPKLNDGTKVQGNITQLADIDYFKLNKIEVKGEYSLPITRQSFAGITVLCGEGDIGGLRVRKGDTLYIDAEDCNVPILGDLTLMAYGV